MKVLQRRLGRAIANLTIPKPSCCEIKLLQERDGWGTLKALSLLGRLLPAATLRERQRASAVGCRRGSVRGCQATEYKAAIKISTVHLLLYPACQGKNIVNGAKRCLFESSGHTGNQASSTQSTKPFVPLNSFVIAVFGSGWM